MYTALLRGLLRQGKRQMHHDLLARTCELCTVGMKD
jgi:hypothetical protein